MKNKSPLGNSWEKYKETLLTPEERAEISLKVALVSELIEARQKGGLTQKQLEEASGVKQPVIARLERGTTDPQLSTVLKLLKPLGKTLAIVPLAEPKPSKGAKRIV